MNILKPCCNRSIDIGLLLARIPLGLVFFMAGLHKIQGGIGKFAEGASKTIPGFLPTPIGMAYLYAVPVAELLVGVMIVVGLLTRVAGLISSLMLVSFMIAVTGFTDKGGPHSSLVMLGMTLMFMLAGGGRFSVDGALLANPKTAGDSH